MSAKDCKSYQLEDCKSVHDINYILWPILIVLPREIAWMISEYCFSMLKFYLNEWTATPEQCPVHSYDHTKTWSLTNLQLSSSPSLLNFHEVCIHRLDEHDDYTTCTITSFVASMISRSPDTRIDVILPDELFLGNFTNSLTSMLKKIPNLMIRDRNNNDGNDITYSIVNAPRKDIIKYSIVNAPRGMWGRTKAFSVLDHPPIRGHCADLIVTTTDVIQKLQTSTSVERRGYLVHLLDYYPVVAFSFAYSPLPSDEITIEPTTANVVFELVD